MFLPPPIKISIPLLLRHLRLTRQGGDLVDDEANTISVASLSERLVGLSGGTFTLFFGGSIVTHSSLNAVWRITTEIRGEAREGDLEGAAGAAEAAGAAGVISEDEKNRLVLSSEGEHVG